MRLNLIMIIHGIWPVTVANPQSLMAGAGTYCGAICPEY